MQLYLARGFSVRSLREVAKKGLAIASERSYSLSQRENWPPGCLLVKLLEQVVLDHLKK